MKDHHFSRQAAAYARYRPGYPPELFDWILARVPGRAAAWDCATGNGQAALALAAHFERVEATDISAKQLEHAPQAPNVRYSRCPADQSPFDANSFALIAVAQALHWFDTDAFYNEARRVARPGALLACWGYGLCELESGLEELNQWFYHDVTRDYWPSGREHLDAAYASLYFPFAALPAPAFEIRLEWNLAELLGYYSSWSACQQYFDVHGEDPVAALLAPRLAAQWGDPTRRRNLRWPLFMKAALLP